MDYYAFKRESDDFTDILGDPTIKRATRTKLAWPNHLLIVPRHQKDSKLESYIVLKYGDELIKQLCKDFSPIPNKDYTPNKRNKEYKY